MCWWCWYWCWEQIDDCYADISKLKFERLKFLKQDIGKDCGHKVWSGYWSWSLIEIMKLNFWGWCLVYILKYFQVEETWPEFWDFCKNLWYDPKKGTFGKHSTLQLRFAFGQVFIFVPYKWSLPEVPFSNWNQFSTTKPAFESLRRVFSLVPWPKCILQSPEQSPEGQSLAPSEEQLAPQLTWHIMQYISYIWTMKCVKRYNLVEQLTPLPHVARSMVSSG